MNTKEKAPTVKQLLTDHKDRLIKPVKKYPATFGAIALLYAGMVGAETQRNLGDPGQNRSKISDPISWAAAPISDGLELAGVKHAPTIDAVPPAAQPGQAPEAGPPGFQKSK